jgi:heat shock protein HslJ
MGLTPILLLIAFGGLAAALWVQLRGFGLGRAAYRRRQARTGLALLGLLLGLGLVQAGHDLRLVGRLTAPETDGAWAAVSIDGRPVSWRQWRLSVTGGKVSGGRDGCNDWGFSEPEVEGGERMINMTLVECPDDPVREAYWTLARARSMSPRLSGDGSLRLAAGGHEAVFRRCRWTEEPLPPGTSGTGPRACVPQ